MKNNFFINSCLALFMCPSTKPKELLETFVRVFEFLHSNLCFK